MPPTGDPTIAETGALDLSAAVFADMTDSITAQRDAMRGIAKEVLDNLHALRTKPLSLGPPEHTHPSIFLPPLGQRDPGTVAPAQPCLPLGMEYVSWTLVSKMAACSMAERLKRFDRLDDGSRLPYGAGSMWNVGGLAFHAAIEEWERAQATDPGPNERALTPDEIAERWRYHWTDQYAAAVLRHGSPTAWRVANSGREDREWWLDHGPQQAAAYVQAQSGREYDMMRTPTGELGIELDIITPASLLGVPVRMIIDQVLRYPQTQDVVVRDLKTGSRMPVDPGQRQFYRLGAAWAMFGDVESKHVRHWYGDYWNARAEKATPAVRLDAEAILPEARHRIEMALNVIADNQFTPNPTYLCASCEMRPYCPTMGDPDTKRPLKLSADELSGEPAGGAIDESLVTE